MIYEKIKNRRTNGKYSQKEVPDEALTRCMDATRLSPSSANRQPLKHVILNDWNLLRPVFRTSSWAGYPSDYQPDEEEMPGAHIVILLDRDISKRSGGGTGIAARSTSMVAYDEVLSSCIPRLLKEKD